MTIKKIYWDSCCFIELFQKRKAEFHTPLSAMVKSAEEKRLIIVTSTVSLAEVCKLPDLGKLLIEQTEKILAFMTHEYIELWAADVWVCKEAHHIIRLLGLKPMDAIHMATAKMAEVPELYTCDLKKYRRDGLIAHDGKLGFRVLMPNNQPLPGELFGQNNAKVEEEQQEPPGPQGRDAQDQGRLGQGC